MLKQCKPRFHFDKQGLKTGIENTWYRELKKEGKDKQEPPQKRAKIEKEEGTKGRAPPTESLLYYGGGIPHAGLFAFSYFMSFTARTPRTSDVYLHIAAQECNRPRCNVTYHGTPIVTFDRVTSACGLCRPRPQPVTKQSSVLTSRRGREKSISLLCAG